jgi:hypothetical protein
VQLRLEHLDLRARTAHRVRPARGAGRGQGEWCAAAAVPA